MPEPVVDTQYNYLILLYLFKLTRVSNLGVSFWGGEPPFETREPEKLSSGQRGHFLLVILIVLKNDHEYFKGVWKMTELGHERYLVPFIRQDLEEKMVFLSGPRQVGKTTLALKLLGGDESHSAYFNWDYEADQRKLLHGMFPADQRLVVLDEIHKYRRWRNWLKGIYDKAKTVRQYLVTGSARLDLYRRGGDALTGRYHSYKLHPFSLREFDPTCSPAAQESLFKYGGFPEPLLSQSDRALRRWQRERMHQVLREDLRDLERVEELVLVARLAERLPDLVGSPLSINALREDLQVAHQTVQNWLLILERLFVLYRIAPYGAPKIRAVKKEQKMYLWDWSVIDDLGARFENMVASHLLRYCDFIEETEGYAMDLRYIRDTDGREIDFLVLKEKKPLFAVECSSREKSIRKLIHYFAARLKVPRFYHVHLGTEDYQDATLSFRVCPFHRFIEELNLP